MAELVGPGAIAEAGATSVYFTTPYPHHVGDKARDTEGNEYLFCDFTATVYYGCLVQITSTHLASPLLGTASIAYRVGIVCSGEATTDNHPTSDNAGWVQIYGTHPAAQTAIVSQGGAVGVSITAGGAYACIPQTSVGTPSGTFCMIAQGTGTSIAQTSVDANIIYGMWVIDIGQTSDLTTFPGTSGVTGPTSVLMGLTSGTNTSAFAGGSFAVFLNYPYVTGITVPFGAATSDV